MNIEPIYKEYRRLKKSIDSQEAICLRDWNKSISVIYEKGKYKVDVDLYTLDITNRKDITNGLYAKYEHKLKGYNFDNAKQDITNSSRRDERRIWSGYLKLKYPDSYLDIKFIDRERPDYYLYVNGCVIAVEVVEAMFQKQGKFRNWHRSFLGKNKMISDLVNHRYYDDSFYLEEDNNMIWSSCHKGMINSSAIRIKIIDAILSKVKKYKNYMKDVELPKEKCILVGYTSIGLIDESDFLDLGRRIAQEEQIRSSHIERIIVTSYLYNNLVEYDRCGEIVHYKIT
ncbi:hypothetical protein [Salisediminibacterium selenitireducens]|uniref:Uncharacterized protein n=1 Tax=Bacillus selenitireducens (strain ATCC 700615 / DSM 15326 / MLS10) TaxID=439292 RepID=D6XVX7_BACIE|nr:hypothetical protein [Salisediminibacterium selenitireducens]ADH97750.1 hypothetical protein Bsel_0203 [[Bacillus] selenitireducens MLS10]